MSLKLFVFLGCLTVFTGCGSVSAHQPSRIHWNAVEGTNLQYMYDTKLHYCFLFDTVAVPTLVARGVTED